LLYILKGNFRSGNLLKRFGSDFTRRLRRAFFDFVRLADRRPFRFDVNFCYRHHDRVFKGFLPFIKTHFAGSSVASEILKSPARRAVSVSMAERVGLSSLKGLKKYSFCETSAPPIFNCVSGNAPFSLAP
jgi:hypothetical protein